MSVVTVFLAWHLQYLGVDFEFEKFFPKNHPESVRYQKHVAQFGYDNDFLHIILEQEPSVFDSSFLRRATEFESALLDLNDVEKVYSPLSLQHVVKSPTGLIVFPLLHLDDPQKLSDDSVRIYGNPLYRAAISQNANALSMYVHHAHFDDPQRSEALLSAIQSKASTFNLNNIRLVGKLSASNTFIQYIQQDFGKFLLGSLVLSFLLLLLIFRNLKSAALPFLISILSIVWMFGLMGFLGFKINLLSSLIPPILFFVSMSDAVHLMNALGKTKRSNRSEELEAAVSIVWTPTLLTSLTTAIGFLSLFWINTEPVQNLGLFTAIGILFAFAITFSFGLLIASLTRFTDKAPLLPIPKQYTSQLINNGKWYVAALLLITLLLLPGVFQLEINAFLLDDLPPSSQVRRDFEFMDDEFGGSKPFEIRVEVMDEQYAVWDKEVMDQLVKIEDYLLQQYTVSNVQSPATIAKYLNMVNNGGLNEYYAYPEKQSAYQSTIRLKNRIDPKRLDKLVTEDGKVARLIGFIPELGSKETGRRNEQMLSYLNKTIASELLSYSITGTTYLIDKSHELLSTNLFSGLFTAVAIIGIVLGIYFRSWKLLIISLIPNLIPLLLVAGIIGWLGISIKMTTAIIFVIAFSIAVDDTIHIMSNYLGSNVEDPGKRMTETFVHAGNAVVITSIIMCAGFCLFLFSSFGATYYMGLFICLALVAALIVDLTVLPILLNRFCAKVKK